MINLFISDLHLEESRPDIAEIFLRFLAGDAMRADALYILGDFFEVWIGDDDRTAFNQVIIDALLQASSQGLTICMTHGNRDFLLGRSFQRHAGIRLLPEEYVIHNNQAHTLLMHGDTLCTSDVKYLKFRKKSRTWLFKTLVQLRSLEKRRALAAHYRAQSKQHTSTSPDYIMDVTQAEVERVMHKHYVQHLIHGHTHRPFVHHFELNGKPASRTVLGAWHEQGSVLVCDGNEKAELITLS